MSKKSKKELAKDKAEKIRLAEIAERVDKARETFRKERDALKDKAPLLTIEILEGIDYTEEAVVKLVNGQYGKVILHPIAEGAGVRAFSGINRKALDEKDKDSEEFSEEEYKFFWTLVSASTGYPIELIKKTFAIGESAQLGARILEMSGFTGDTPEEIEDF